MAKKAKERFERRYSNFKNFSELQTALSDKLKASAKALDLTRKEYAKRLGVSMHTLIDILDKGYPFNQEFALRAVKVHEGFSFSRKPSLSHRLRNNKSLIRIETYIEPALYAKFEKVCQAENCAASTVMYNYVKMGIEGVLATTTWLQAYEAAWHAILAAELQRSPWLNYVLEMEPGIAEKVKGKRGIQFPEHLPTELPSSMVLRELAAGNPFDGPAVPVVTDWLDKWRHDD